MTESRHLLFVLMLIAMVGCGTQPISEIAVEGTSVIIGIPRMFEVGYGTRLVSQQALSLTPANTSSSTITGPVIGDLLVEDLQRGEMLLTLFDDATNQPIAVLPVRYVAAVASDPGTSHARNYGPGSESRQAALLVDIPVKRADGTDLVPDGQEMTFSIQVRRFRRALTPTDQTTFVELKQSMFDTSEDPTSPLNSDWYGWGAESSTAAPTARIPIRIADQIAQSASEIARYTPIDEVWTPLKAPASPPYFPGVATIAKLTNLAVSYSRSAVPDPEFTIKLNSGSTSVGAFTMVVGYPAHRIAITGVRLLRLEPEGAWVSHSYAPSAIPACNVVTPGTLTINAADPAATVTGVVVSYKLTTDVSVCPAIAPLAPSEIVVNTTTSRAYTLNGATLNVTPGSPGGPDFEDI
jgi:hypothetical protein